MRVTLAPCSQKKTSEAKRKEHHVGMVTSGRGMRSPIACMFVLNWLLYCKCIAVCLYLCLDYIYACLTSTAEQTAADKGKVQMMCYVFSINQTQVQ